MELIANGCRIIKRSPLMATGLSTSTDVPLATVSTREYGLDALRVFAFTILILYHTGMGFVSWDFHIKDPARSTGLEYVMIFFNRWRLPLLFFISGAGVAFSLRRRGLGQFAGERFVRLFIPLVFGMLVVVPPQIYFERLTQGVQFASYWDFWRTVFDFVPYPEGGALSWHHLWFVLYVFVYALFSIPLFALARSAMGKRGLSTFAGWMERWPWFAYAVNVPNLLVGIFLGPHWPTTHNLVSDWANLTGSWLTFLWGFVFASDRRLLDVVTRRRREFLIVAIIFTVALFTLGAIVAGMPVRQPMLRIVLGNFVSGYMGMAWIFALIGYSRVLITAGSPALSYATEVVYPFYIVHQTITIALLYWLLPWHVGVWVKFPVIAAGTFLGSWVIVEFVRRVTPLRPLFGLRLKAR